MTAQSDRTIRILVVDDHQVVCQRVPWFLNGKPDPEDVGETPTGLQALDERPRVAEGLRERITSRQENR
jgi:DNA-binding NarL/FixJ family response regulator